MERRESHTVNIIKSASGVNIYSTIEQEDVYLKRNLQDYDSLEDAQNKITSELRAMHGLSKLYGMLKPAEKAAFVILVLKDVISNVTNTHGGMDNDALVILGIIGIYVATSFADDMNTNSAVLAKHRLLAVKEAEKADLPQYQKDFLLYPKENSQQ